MSGPSVRRIRSDEWRAVRALRLEATADPDAAIAFLEDHDEVAARPDDFWRSRAEAASGGETAAQFVAVDGDEWVGSLSAIIRATGQADHLGRIVDDRRGFVVGVYVRPERRGSGAVDLLLAAAAQWAAGLGLDRLHLDVHRDNTRAQAAYRRAGFEPTGETVSGPIGPEIVMVRPLPQSGSRGVAGMVPSVTTPRRLLLVNGPNLNLLGIREPALYGTDTLADVESLVSRTAAAYGFEVEAVQSNHEGVLLDAIHAARETCAGIVINPGGLTHTSVVLRDALSGVALPVAEVHVTDVVAREEFRHHSYVRDVAAVHVVGEGVQGYATAVRLLIDVITGRADG